MTEFSGAVTASTSGAAEAGARILREGGNAADAAVAAALASCVADPCNTGLGGYGGHMVVAQRNAVPVCVDFNTWLPEAEAPHHRGRTYPKSGPESTAIPNVVAGLARAHSDFGSLSWSRLVEPALEFAAHGALPSGSVSRAFEEVRDAPFVDECFLFETAGSSENPRFRQPALARTLEDLAQNGPGWFHEGPVGDLAVESLRRAGRQIARSEWAEAALAVRVLPAAHVEIGGASLFSAPLGTSGSVSMFATLAAGREIAVSQGLDRSAATIAWAKHLASIWSYRFGTPDGNDFDGVAVEDWIERALSFRETAAIPADAGHTCHLNAADREGTLVAATLTHGPFWFGARWVVPGTGVIMNAGMHLFGSAPGTAIGKRFYAVTNMTPTVVRTRDGVSLAIGCPGARRIPTIVGLVLARHLFGGLPLQEAISRGRFHSETERWVSIERERCDSETEQALGQAFGRVEEENFGSYFGPLTAIRRDVGGRLELGLDDRAGRGYGAAEIDSA